MSLYNQLMGINKLAPVVICELFDIPRLDEGTPERVAHILKTIPRFRDAYINEDRQLVIYTRTGSGNREAYDKRTESNTDYTGLFNEDLCNLPGFIKTYDGTFDNTFAYFVYEPHSEEIKEFINILDPIFYIGQDPETKMADLLEALKGKDPNNPHLESAKLIGQRLAEQIAEAQRANDKVTVLEI